MHPLTVLTRAVQPTGDRPLVQAEGDDDRLDGAAMCQQRHHQDHQRRSVMQAKEHRPSRLGEARLTDIAVIASIGPTVDADVALAYLASCATGQVGAELRLWVHERLFLSTTGRSASE